MVHNIIIIMDELRSETFLLLPIAFAVHLARGRWRDGNDEALASYSVVSQNGAVAEGGKSTALLRTHATDVRESRTCLWYIVSTKKHTHTTRDGFS